jgi:O-antigen ligase
LIISSLMSYSINAAFNSSLYLLLNMMGAFAVFLILLNKKVTLEQFQNLIYWILLVNVIFGLIQILLFKFTGISIGLGNNYNGQLTISQIPGFRAEANTHGKLVCFGILFCIPPMIRNFKQKKYRTLFMLLLLTSIISPTRSATYAMLIAVIVLMLWFIKQKLLSRMMTIMFGAFFGVGILVFMVSSGLINVSGYSATKLDNFFLLNIDDLNNDGSSGFRLKSLTDAFDLWNESIKNRIIGVGYGQAYANVQGAGFIRIGGNDFTSILVGTGLIGVLAYLFLFIIQANVLKIGARSSLAKWHKIFCEQLMFINIYFLVISFLSGCTQTPEIWMTFGISAYISFCNKYRKDNENEEY